MNFFKSILSDDPEPENMNNNRRPEPEYTTPNSTSSGEVSGAGAGVWTFGDLVKAVTTRSESVLETYRRDLKEFGSGLRKESDLFVEVANRAVKDLPASIEVGLKSTVEIISQGKDVALEPSNVDDIDSSESVVYSRFDKQLNAIESDVRTYCDEPEDVEEYNEWKLGFKLSDREGEIEKFIRESGSVGANYAKVVPSQVDYERFWCRYFYKVWKVRQQEEMRTRFVKRLVTVDDEYELSWDVDDDDNDNDNDVKSRTVASYAVEDDNMKNNSDVASVETNNVAKIDQNDEYNEHASKDCVDDKNDKNNVSKVDQNDDYSENVGEDCVDDKDDKNDKKDVEEVKLSDDGKVGLVVKVDEDIGCSKSLGKGSREDEELEWDEIGDVGDDDDEKYVSRGEVGKKGEVFKRVNVGEDDEELSWDIEDDDEPVKTVSGK